LAIVAALAATCHPTRCSALDRASDAQNLQDNKATQAEPAKTEPSQTHPSGTGTSGAPASSASSSASAPLPASEAPLYRTIASLDTELFDAYNHCDLTKLSTLLADDLEFYHDQTGLSVGKQSLLNGVKNNICGKVQRELVAGSLEVYPLKGYGAVEIGSHRFHHPAEAATETGGEAKFVMLWRQTGADWKLSRVISFNHFALPTPTTK
jgi:hypothetical protein